MKKILTFIIIIAMTLSLGVTAFAATPATVTVASPTAAVNPGSTVDIAVTIANNPGMDVMKLKFSYDTTALTLKDIELGSVMTGTFTKTSIRQLLFSKLPARQTQPETVRSSR